MSEIFQSVRTSSSTVTIRSTVQLSYKMHKSAPGLAFRHVSRRLLSSKAKRSVPDKIPVQLLRDFQSMGSAGEVVRVKPAHMRNYLHHNNGACYLTPGSSPRIPVVKRAKIEKTIEEVETEKPAEEETESPVNAMSLDELSSLFKKLKGNKKSSNRSSVDAFQQSFESSDDITSYTSSELRETIPNNHTIEISDDNTLPLSKDYLASLVYEMAGIKIASSTIRLHFQGKNLNEINTVGDYTWFLDVPHEGSTVQKNLFIRNK